jgi:lincosamide nucleotidyltransferase A/C/D/E
MTGVSAARLCRLLEQHEIWHSVVGGWGVDALLGRCTRPHHDLDLVVGSSRHLPAWQLLHDNGYSLAHLWEENIERAASPTGQVLPSAYVLEDREARCVDIHVVDDSTTTWLPLWRTDREFLPGALDATGSIEGVRVRCMSAQMQLAAHEGYALPEAHRADVAHLRELVGLDQP